jgi:CRP-like cAMP-binding protein
MIKILSEEDNDLLQNESLIIHYPKGEIIIRENTPFNQIKIVKSGMVKISKNASPQKTVIIKLLKEGDFIGLDAFFNGKINQITAIALTETDVQLIKPDIFSYIYHHNITFNQEIIAQIAESNKSLLYQLMSRSVKRLPGRVADAILYLYELNNNSLSFTLPLSRIEMAQLAGTTKESLIRTLAEFKHDKIIELDDRAININSMEIIRTLSKFG